MPREMYKKLNYTLYCYQSCQGLPTRRLGEWMHHALLNQGVGCRLTLPSAFIRRLYEGVWRKGALLCQAYGGACYIGTLTRMAYEGAVDI